MYYTVTLFLDTKLANEHSSETFRDILSLHRDFRLKHRGKVQMKGKGLVNTFEIVEASDRFERTLSVTMPSLLINQ